MNCFLKHFIKNKNTYLWVAFSFLFVGLRLFLIHYVIIPMDIFPPSPIDDGWYDIRYGSTFINKNLLKFSSLYLKPTRTFYGQLIGYIFTVFGHDPVNVVYFQIFISLLALLSLRRLSSTVFSPGSGKIAVCLWGLHSLSMLYDVQILKYSLILSFIIFSLDSFYLLKKRFSLLRLFFFIGSCVFLMFLRFQFLPIVIWLVVALFFKEFKFRPVLTFLLFLIVALMFLKMASSFYKTHLGIHTYMGFSHFSNGRFCNINEVLPNTLGHAAVALEREPLLREKISNCSFINNFFLQKTFEWICDNPFKALLLTLRKFFSILSGTEDFSSTRIDGPLCFSKFYALPWVNFRLLLILAFPGIVILFNKPKQKPLFIFLMFQVMMILGTITSKPYRLLLSPILVCYSAETIIFLINARRIKQIIGLSLLGFLLTMFPNSNALVKSEALSMSLAFEQKQVIGNRVLESLILKFVSNPELYSKKYLYELAEKLILADNCEDASLILHYLLLPKNESQDFTQNELLKLLVKCYMKRKRYLKAKTLLENCSFEKDEALKKMEEEVKFYAKYVLNPLNY